MRSVAGGLWNGLLVRKEKRGEIYIGWNTIESDGVEVPHKKIRQLRHDYDVWKIKRVFPNEIFVPHNYVPSALDIARGYISFSFDRFFFSLPREYSKEELVEAFLASPVEIIHEVPEDDGFRLEAWKEATTSRKEVVFGSEEAPYYDVPLCLDEDLKFDPQKYFSVFEAVRRLDRAKSHVRYHKASASSPVKRLVHTNPYAMNVGEGLCYGGDHAPQHNVYVKWIGIIHKLAEDELVDYKFYYSNSWTSTRSSDFDDHKMSVDTMFNVLTDEFRLVPGTIVSKNEMEKILARIPENRKLGRKYKQY